MDAASAAITRFRAYGEAEAWGQPNEAPADRYPIAFAITRVDPADRTVVSDQQILQILAGPEVAGQEKNCGTGRDNECRTDDRFLDLRPAAFTSVQQHGTRQCRRIRHHLHGNHAFIQVHHVSRDHTQPGNLCNREVDEDNAALQHFAPQRHMGRQHQQPRQ